VVALLQRAHARADIDHHARAFMAEDAGKDTFRVGAGEGVLVGVAQAGGLDLHQHLALARAFQVHFLDRQGLAGFPGNGGAGLHCCASSISCS
jgi:hypothetical protein